MSTQRPAWWQLLVFAALLIAALIWVHELGLPGQAEMVLQVLGLVLFLGLMLAWLGVNTPTLLSEDEPPGPEWYRVWEVPAAPMAQTETTATEPGLVWGEPEAGKRRDLEPQIAGRVLD